MSADGVNDLTDRFDERLMAMQKQRAPEIEMSASIAVYERTRTARAIYQSLFSGEPQPAVVVELAVEIGREVELRQAEHGS